MVSFLRLSPEHVRRGPSGVIPEHWPSPRRHSSPALIADGNHARTDGFISLGVLASAGFLALGAQVADPIIGLVITLVILRIT